MDRKSQRKKRRRTVPVIVVVLLLAVLGGLAYMHFEGQKDSRVNGDKVANKTGKEVKKADNEKPKSGQSQEPQPAAQKPESGQTTLEKVDSLLQKMTLQEKVGQLLMVGFYGTQEDKNIKNLLQNDKVGGVILFDRNMQNPRQVARLTNQLQQDAVNNGLDLPLMISTDQEGGPVLRMRSQVSQVPAQQELGRNATAEEEFNIAKLNGEELAAMGINLDFAPVLDLSDQDKRSFGSDPAKGFTLGLQAVKGLNAANVTATLKHFPGNGRVVVDPHLDTSIVKADRNTLETNDMVPFKQMIQTQNDNQFFVMVTHVKYPAFDANMPASLSKPIIQNLLRDQLGYKGIVITDDLDMGAVSKYYSYAEIGAAALNAGADILLVCHQYDHQTALYNGILKAVQTGKLTEDRINESVKRILTYKLTRLANQPPGSEDHAAQTVNSAQHKQILSNYKNAHGIK